MPINSPSAFALPNSEVALGTNLLEDGDVALVLKKNGSVVPLTTGIDPDLGRHLLAAAGSRPLTQEELAIVEQGRRLFALTMAVQSPVIMTILYELMDNPEVFDEDRVKMLSRGN